MTDKKDDDKKKDTGKKKTLSLSGKSAGALGLKGGTSAPRQSVSSGRTGQTVAVEVRRSRSRSGTGGEDHTQESGDNRALTDQEREARAEALRKAASAPKEPSLPPPVKPTRKERPPVEEEIIPTPQGEDERRAVAERAGRAAAEKAEHYRKREEEDESKAEKKQKVPPKRTGESRRRSSKLTVTQVLNEEYETDIRQRSLAAQRRAREREKMRMAESQPIEHIKQVRDVTIPEVITVQELANRMAERIGDVVKKLMEMGVMATATQAIDADTAELITQEFGHKVVRVSESDVEIGLGGEEEDTAENLLPRPPVVTIMGHVDHGKTSLLDAIRETDVVAGESGGITQHIGAYQVTLKGDKKITFLDTPGHAAFTEMRARGADITDIVVLVVAANDSVMPQTVEAISHAKAASKPIIVAINKCDLPEANPTKVRNELLQYEIVPEELGGDVLTVEVSALTKQGLDKLEEIILLQAEVLELKANPNRVGQGAVVEARLEQGRGSVATVLIQRGTLHVGDVFVTGSEWGKVRALLDDHGNPIKEAIPGQPVEVLGLNGTPEAGDDFVVVNNEAKARQIAEYRSRKKRQMEQARLAKATGSLDQILAQLKKGEARALPVIIKADVHGSVEAIISSLKKLTEENEEVKVNILHSGVGGITESDVTLAKSTNAFLIGFNVRANAQAREQANRDKIDIRYYSVIYEVIDDVKGLLTGMLAPEIHENLIGYAEIRQVFNITKVGKVAGCMITDGVVKRGAKVRLLRDDVVIHEGNLKTLQRFKDEVKEVAQGYECGMAFENYDDIKEGDTIECFEVIEKARQLETASNG